MGAYLAASEAAHGDDHLRCFEYALTAAAAGREGKEEGLGGGGGGQGEGEGE